MLVIVKEQAQAGLGASSRVRCHPGQLRMSVIADSWGGGVGERGSNCELGTPPRSPGPAGWARLLRGQWSPPLHSEDHPFKPQIALCQYGCSLSGLRGEKIQSHKELRKAFKENLYWVPHPPVLVKRADELLSIWVGWQSFPRRVGERALSHSKVHLGRSDLGPAFVSATHMGPQGVEITSC